MKNLKTVIAICVAFGFLTAGCADKSHMANTSDQKDSVTSSCDKYSTKLGAASTKKDTNK